MLDKAIHFIIRKSKLVETVFAFLVFLSLICIPMVEVNYDLSKYLPETAPSKVGLNRMEEEFGYPGTARIMVGPVSLYEAKVFKDRIATVDGVDMVLWADTNTNVYESELFVRYDDIEDYYKDQYAVMDVTFEEGESTKLTHEAIGKIKDMLGDKGYLTGPAVQNKALNDTLIKEVSIAMAMGVVMIWGVLALTTTAWMEPALFLLIMGIAIVLNMGSNIFLGTISFLTFSVGAILQLAIAMDYSIFLLHAFTREKEKGISSEDAIANALREAISSIMASGATTIVGFIVLTLMRFTIGWDLGIVLAKGIVISLLTVLVLMPALILQMNDKIQKTAHRSFMPSFMPLGRLVYKVRHAVVILTVLITIPSFVGQSMNSFLYGNSALGSSEGTKVYEDEQAINARFGRSNLLLAIIPNTNMVSEKQLAQEIEDLPYTKSVTSLASTLPDGVPADFMPDSVTSLLHTENYSRIMIYIKTSDESELAFRCTNEIQDIVQKYYPKDSYVVGMTPSTNDIKNTITDDYKVVNLLSLLGVAIVVMFTFKSLLIPLVVMIPIEAAIFINMVIPYLLGDTMIFMGYIIVSCLQLGATIDYSILLTSNYMDNRQTMNKKEAAIDAIGRSALSVLTSGSILTIVGYGLFFTSSVAAIAGIGRLVGRGAAFSLVLVLFLLPILLVAFDKPIFIQKNWSEKRMERFRKKRAEHRKQRKTNVPVKENI